MNVGACLIGFVLAVPTPAIKAEGAGNLAEPVLVEADGRPIDVGHVGHAAPFFGDIDGDGKRDLLVGEFYQGRLNIYRNVGTDTRPRFEAPTVFQNDAPEGRIPAG